MKKWAQRGGYPRSLACDRWDSNAGLCLFCAPWGSVANGAAAYVPLPGLHPRSPRVRVIYYFSGMARSADQERTAMEKVVIVPGAGGWGAGALHREDH